MNLTIQYYALFREQIGTSQQVFATDATTIANLLQHLAEFVTFSFPLVVAVNNQIVPEQDFNILGLFGEGDKIAIMPPFAGG